MNAEITEWLETPGFPPGFHTLLGQFHGMWLLFDVELDYSIGHFLNTPPAQTHVVVSGMMFGSKLRLLIELLKRSKHQKKETLLKSLRTLQAAKRDIITHSYIESDATRVAFVHRNRGEYSAGKLPFTIGEFKKHVIDTVKAAQDYQNNFGASPNDLLTFAYAALKL